MHHLSFSHKHTHTKKKSILHKDESTEKKGLSLAYFATCMLVSGQVEAYSGRYFWNSVAGSQGWRYLEKALGYLSLYCKGLCMCVGVLFSKKRSMWS